MNRNRILTPYEAERYEPPTWIVTFVWTVAGFLAGVMVAGWYLREIWL